MGQALSLITTWELIRSHPFVVTYITAFVVVIVVETIAGFVVSSRPIINAEVEVAV